MKKYLLIILFIILILPITTNAESVQTGTFNYLPAFEEVAEETYYYSDDYFRQSGTIYNEHLLAMSYNLAISTFEIRNYTYSKALLEEIGFQDIEAQDMIEKPTIDTIGTVIGHKEIDGNNIIVVAIRGEKYDSEWGNNFIVGSEGDAEGFSVTSEKVISRIKTYIANNNLNNIKLWIAGYSRAGAVADLTGVYLNENLGEFNATTEDLYIYTFETPAASISSNKYDNIYVVTNINDMIPRVYPEDWGFNTNGNKIEIGEEQTITTYAGLEEQVEFSEESLQNFNEDFINWLASRLDRETYSDKLEEPVSQLFDIYFGKSDEDRQKLLNFFMEDIKSELLDNQENFKYLKSNAWSVLSHNSDYLYSKISKKVEEIIESLRDVENAQVLTDEEFDIIKNAVSPILRVMGPVLVDDSSYYDGIDYDYYYTYIAEDYSLTDVEMGTKYGTSDGMWYGYDDAFEGNIKNPNNYDLTIYDYGDIFIDAYIEAYINTYNEYYDLGILHMNNLAERGKYDGVRTAYEEGYNAGINGEEANPSPQDFSKEDWMTDEYIEAYNAAYKEEYLKGYEDGLQNQGVEEEFPEDKAFYHFATLLKNVQTIKANHYPQINLQLIHKLDSYYLDYEIVEGANQELVKEEITEDLKVIINGPIEKLIKVQVDDIDCDETMCEIISGSTIVKLKEDFIKTLSSGTHEIKMIYIDKTISTNLYIKDNDEYNPDTADEIIYYIIIFVTSILGVFGSILYKNERLAN